ncbi:hypothetical protein [Enhydrobacter sp.]|jgi:PBP1b-binding outer membrane lipoprotein LpoB|nr:hypothetical protein [Enhydrobacter sp.]WIM10104.1 MAG: hypothetical protein OJF58_001057 [Enhydrobacter sp.]
MMRTALALLLAALLGGCVTASDGDNSLERMIRNHNAAVQSAG